MKVSLKATLTVVMLVSLLAACQPHRATPEPGKGAASSPAPTVNEIQTVPITLPVLNALLADDKFKAELKSKLMLTDEQIAQLQKISQEEVAKLRSSNAENQNGGAEAARQNALAAIRKIIGEEKAEQFLALGRARWSTGSEELEAAAAKAEEPTMLKGPNAVPKDTRIVVNIPAFRMDVFDSGRLVKSYKVGIGYPQFPLPQGLRKAQTIIFNPTWTPPDEPWVTLPRGTVIEAGSKLNPLGLIKIPIGSPSLIHGGKPLAKIGTFASHGCVGLTNAQVTDFAKVLADASKTELSAEKMAAYMKNRRRTQVVKLANLVPVELRYETIVVEGGKLHVYRDVYDQDTNTEENLRAVLEANGLKFDDLSDEEKTRALEAVNFMSRRPQIKPAPKPSPAANQNAADKAAAAAAQKAEAARLKKLRNQKEIAVEIPRLVGKGYPAPVDLNTGAGVTTAVAQR